MDYFILLSVSGIAMGVIYGLIGMGYALIFKATSVVNFAQGEVMMLISYMAFSIATHGPCRSGGCWWSASGFRPRSAW